MHRLHLLLILLSWLPSVSPISAPLNRHRRLQLSRKLFPHVPRQLIPAQNASLVEQRCRPDSPLGIQPACWNDLRVEEYVQNWLRANQTAANCAQLGFAQCFLQYSGWGGRTCDLISSETCAQPDTKARYDSPQQFYVLWNIWQINRLFNDYSQALWHGHQLAANTIDEIVAMVAPETSAKSRFSTQDLYQVLNGGFNLAQWWDGPIPGLGGWPLMIGLTQWALVGITKAFIFIPLFNKPEKLRQSTDDRFYQLGEIGGQLSDLVLGYQKELQKGIQMAQANSSLFLAMTSNGAFSMRLTSGRIVDKSEELFKTLKVFVLAEALKSNGVVVAKSVGWNILDRHKEVDNKDIINCPKLGPNGNCHVWWPDPKEKNMTTYSFHWDQDWQHDWTKLMDRMYERKWATFADIFPTSECYGKQPTFDPKTLRMICPSTVKVCEWHYESDVALVLEEKKQWENCDKDKVWITQCDSFEDAIDIPNSYIGPLLDNKNSYCRISHFEELPAKNQIVRKGEGSDVSAGVRDVRKTII